MQTRGQQRRAYRLPACNLRDLTAGPNLANSIWLVRVIMEQNAMPPRLPVRRARTPSIFQPELLTLFEAILTTYNHTRLIPLVFRQLTVENQLVPAALRSEDGCCDGTFAHAARSSSTAAHAREA